ncbi:hypothetical protein QTP88_013904 [Uroleucon formosanum]
MSPSTVQMQNLNGSPYNVSSAPEFRQEESTAVEEKLMVAVRIRPLSTNETDRSLYVVDSKEHSKNTDTLETLEDELLLQYALKMSRSSETSKQICMNNYFNYNGTDFWEYTIML